MNTLHLTIKKQWFDMIDADIKTEEYRDITPFWSKRLLCDVSVKDPSISIQQMCDLIIRGSDDITYDFGFYNGDKILFANGGHFHARIPKTIKTLDRIEVGEGRPEWGAEAGKKYFVIKLLPFH